MTPRAYTEKNGTSPDKSSKKISTRGKKDNKEVFFTLGISFVGVSVVFFTAVNKVIGATFFALGILYMIIGGRAMRKK